MPPRPAADWLIVQGDADEVVDAAKLLAGQRGTIRVASSSCSPARSTFSRPAHELRELVKIS